MHGRFVDRVVIAALGCVAVGALAVAGCGGDGDSSSTSTGASGASGASGGTPLSQDEFVTQANAICGTASDQAGALQRPTDIASTADYLTKVLQIYGDLNTKLQALIPPTDLQDKYNQLLSSEQETLSGLQDMEAAAKAGDKAQVSAISQKVDATNAARVPIAKDLGIPNCAAASQPAG
jgi:hypothetical protein